MHRAIAPQPVTAGVGGPIDDRIGPDAFITLVRVRRIRHESEGTVRRSTDQSQQISARLSVFG